MVATEKHYTVKEIGKLWHMSEKVVRGIFREEPGIIRFGTPETRFKRAYESMRIPESVMVRVHQKLSMNQP